MYKCGNCNKIVKMDKGVVRCPFCGYKILFKERAGVIREIKAR